MGAGRYLSYAIYWPTILVIYCISLRNLFERSCNFELIMWSFKSEVCDILDHLEGFSTVWTNYFSVVVSSIGEYQNYRQFSN